MKLLRFGDAGHEKPGVFYQDKIHDLSVLTGDIGEAFLAGNGVDTVRSEFLKNPGLFPVVSAPVRLGSPIDRPSKIVCVGLNYSDHATETGAAMPKEPILFFKSTTALNGPNDPVVIPHHSKKTDWEVELAVVIGRRASMVSEERALDHVAGYCVHNDYSEREFQLERGGQWVKGKSCDTFAPLGPYLVTPDEIQEVDNLRLWLKVNGELVQDGNTKNLIFKVPFLVSYISRFMTLLPGDVISTGTPAGVGLGYKPPRYLRPGDVVELGIDGLGRQRQVLKAYDDR